jgi:hypothetical protein
MPGDPHSEILYYNLKDASDFGVYANTAGEIPTVKLCIKI